MTLRYNPQSLEKQVRKWPVFFSEQDLHSDIKIRLNQMLGNFSDGLINPFSVELPFDEDIIYEYGVDACRLAVINANYSENSQNLLEPSYKWIAKLHEYFIKNNNSERFNPIYWLDALIQFQDHIEKRNSDRLAFSFVMKALKEAPPNACLENREKELIYACLFPFTPIYVLSNLVDSNDIIKINKILESYNEYICVKIALENGGWHWGVFNRNEYKDNPIKELNKIKWIKKATENKKIILKDVDGGIRICF